ncbi:MAG: hypothetical protein ACTTIZ_04360 [Treponema sp.]
MKKIEKRKFYIAFFCAIAIALFSLESAVQVEKESVLIEDVEKSTTRKNAIIEPAEVPLLKETSNKEGLANSPEKFIPSQAQETTNNTIPYIEAKKEDTTTSSSTVEKNSSIETPSEKTKKEEPKEEETEFSSIQSSGLTLANGESWYFEEYDKNGNVVSVASYNKKRLISKSQFEYNEEGKKLSATLTEPKKIIKLTFDDKGMEIGRTEYKKRKGEMGDIYSSQEKKLDDEGRLQEEISTENGITTKKVYTYADKKITTETVFENGMKTLFIEYQENVKIVHIFDGENEISVFEEALE